MRILKICLLTFLLSFLSHYTVVIGQTMYKANLDEAQANAGMGTGSTASGSAAMTLNAAQDALEYSITLNGVDLDGLQTADPSDDVTALHFHAAPAGSNGGVAFGLIAPNHDGDDIVIDPVAGTITGRWENTDPNPLSGQLANLMSEGLYLNLHTTTFPAGAIRGQVFEMPAEIVPTLSQWGMIILALCFMIVGAVAVRKGAALTTQSEKI